MAKSKLVIRIIDAMDAASDTLKGISKTMKEGKSVDPVAAEATLTKQYAAVDAAVKALDDHLLELARRENSTKVADKLRKMKNVFKDKEALINRRKSCARFLIETLKPQIAESKKNADKILNKLHEEKAFWDKVFAPLRQSNATHN